MRSPHSLKIRTKGIEAEGRGLGIIGLVVVVAIIAISLTWRF